LRVLLTEISGKAKKIARIITRERSNPTSRDSADSWQNFSYLGPQALSREKGGREGREKRGKERGKRREICVNQTKHDSAGTAHCNKLEEYKR
jgi:hypothetical protein